MAATALAALLGLQAFQVSSAYSATRGQADAAVAQGNYEAGVYGTKANVADQQAADAIQRGAEQEGVMRGQTRQAIGAARAAAGAGGVSATTGSSLDMQADTARVGELDALTIRNNAAREAWGYNVEATQYRNQGAMAKAAGQNTAAGLRAQATSGLLGGIAQGVNMYSQMSGDRVPNGGGMSIPRPPRYGYNFSPK